MIDKYIVRPILDDGSDEISEGKALPTGEFFVLRSQDMLAVPALWAYVGTIRTAMDVLRSSDSGDGSLDVLADNLANFADDVSDLATMWAEISKKKLPD